MISKTLFLLCLCALVGQLSAAPLPQQGELPKKPYFLHIAKYFQYEMHIFCHVSFIKAIRQRDA